MKEIKIKRIISISVIDITTNEVIMSFDYEPEELMERNDNNARENEENN